MAVTPPPDRLEPRPPRKGRSVNGIFFDSSPGQATSAFVRPGQQATGLRKRTAQEIALSDYITKMEEARNKRVIGDDIGAAPGLIADVLYRHGIKYPIESGIRTATGQNAAVYLNPFNNVSLGERIARAGEDAINIASVIPGARAAANAVGDTLINRFVASLPARQAEQLAAYEAYDVARGKINEAAVNRLRQTPAPPRIPGQPAAPRPPQFTDAERAELERLRPKFARPEAQPQPIFTRSELAKQKAEQLRPGVMSNMKTIAVADPPLVGMPEEGKIRVWHTNPESSPLPEKLNPWEDYLGVETAPERRNSTPQGNLLTSGFYNTDARKISETYGKALQDARQMGYYPTGSYIPREADEFVWGGFDRSQMVDINTPIRDLKLFSPPWNAVDGALSTNLRGGGTRIARNSAIDPNPQNVIDETDLDISKWNFGGKQLDELTIYDLINAAPSEQAARAVVMSIDKPIITTSNTRIKYPLYRNPGGAPTKSVMARDDMPAVLIDSRPSADWMDYGPLNTEPNFPDSRIYVRDGFGNISAFSGLPYKGRSTRGNIDYGREYEMFPTNSPYTMKDARWSSKGTNYFDLPISRDPQTGAITEVSGMKALDIGSVGRQERSIIAQETRDWLVRDYGIDPNDPDLADVIDRIIRDKDSLGFSLMDFRNAQSDIIMLVNRGLAQQGMPNEKMGKDIWFKFLKDKLGYEVLPHPGGVTRGDVPHQAFVFNSPEKLPPSTYVPRVMPPFNSDLVAGDMNSYLRALSEARRGSRGRTPMPFRTPSGNYLQSLYAGYLANQGLGQSPRGRQNIR